VFNAGARRKSAKMHLIEPRGEKRKKDSRRELDHGKNRDMDVPEVVLRRGH